MNKLKILLLLLICFLPFLSPRSSAGTFSNETGNNRIALHLNKYGNRPSSPSQYIIECEYSDGCLIFYMSQNLENVSVCIESGQFMHYLGIVTQDENVLPIFGYSGSHILVCTTPDDEEYFGQIIL